MSLTEALEFPLVSCDLYFASDFWKQKVQAIEKRDEIQLRMLAELNAISQKMTILIKRPPVVVNR